ncbi:TRAP transporter small permease [Geminicoccaceae bacterium 1502E]|nr:TRAP transporter small permease [Geminicoccaceae bacterium 1502E]
MLRAFERGLVAANRFVIAGLLAVMAVLVVGNVVLRYLFGTSLSWVEELTRYMMIWTAWLGAGLAFRSGTHVAVEVLQDALPAPCRRLLRQAILALAMLFMAVIVWLGIRYAVFAWRQHSPVLGLPLGMVYLAVPAGALLVLLHLLLAARRVVAGEAEPVAGTAPAVE